MSMDIPFYPEISRKLFHLSSTITPFAYLVLSRGVTLSILGVLLAISVAVEVLRQASPGFANWFRGSVGFMVRQREWGRVSGATYVVAAQFICILLFPRMIAVGVLLILGVSDSAASLFGMRYGRSQFLGKSLAGSLAFFVTALAILCVLLPEHRGAAFVAALAGTLAEALPTVKLGPLELNDNLLVPLLSGAVLWVLLALTGSPGPGAGFAA